MSRYISRWLLCLVLLPATAVTAGDRVKSGLQSGEMITTIFEPVNVTGEHAGDPYCLICENGLSPVVMIFAREVNEPLLGLIGKLDEAVTKNRDDNAAGRKRELEEEKQGLIAEFAAKQLLRTAESNLEAAKNLAAKGIAGFDLKVVEDAMKVARTKHVAAQAKLNEIRAAKKSSPYASDLGSFVVFLSEQAGLAEKLQEEAKKRGIKDVVLSIDAPAGPEGFKVSKEADVTVVLYREHLVKANHAFRKGELTEAAGEAILADLPKILAAK